MRQQLYKLDRPLTFRDRDDKIQRTLYVISSFNHPAIIDAGGTAETYIFPANELGEIIDWSELYGSFQGAHNHDRAMREFRTFHGYEIVTQVLSVEFR